MAQQYRHEYVVKGCFRFPIDMLRYDQSFPFSESDSYIITEDENSVDRFVKLVHYDEKNWEPGKPRWSSFHWQVVEHRMFKV